MDAFISWTGADRDVKNVVVERLQALGITCFDSDENCTSDFSAECIMAIRKCALFIVLISDASMARGYVKNEVITAREQEDEGTLNILVYKLTDNPYTPAFSGYLNHISFVTGNLILRRQTGGGESTLDQLIRRAQLLLELRRNGDPEKPFVVNKPIPDGLEITASGYFVPGSRDDVLSAMDENFSRTNVTVLREFAGFGKRSAIKKYVQLHNQQCKEAYLLQANGSTLRDFLQNGLQFSNLHDKAFDNLDGEQLLQAKLKELKKLEQTTLLAIADLDLSDVPEDSLCQKLLSLKCRLLLLTQNSAEYYSDYFPVIRVGRLTDEQLLTLFFHYYKVHEDQQDDLTPPLQQFFSSIGGHTRTVELTASVLYRDLKIPPEQVPGCLCLHNPQSTPLQDRVLEQLSNIFDMAKLTREEHTAMLVAACLAVPSLSIEQYKTVLAACNIPDSTVMDQLEQHRWLDVDLHNRTVSIEPLLTQIVIGKSQGYEAVLLQCHQHLEQLFSQNVFTVGKYANDVCLRLMHFYRILGLPELIDLVEVLRCQTNDVAVEPDTARSAVSVFCQRFPESDFSESPEASGSCSREQLVYTCQVFVRTHLLPAAKLLQFGKADILLDYSESADRLAAMHTQDGAELLEMDAEFGMSMEQLRQWAQLVRRDLETHPRLQQDDPETMLFMEFVTFIDAYMSRNRINLQMSTNRILQLVELAPELAEDPENDMVIFMPLMAAGFVYLRSQLPAAAARICRQALALNAESQYHTFLRKTYITALQQCEVYSQELFDTYRALLANLDKNSGTAFAEHSSLRQEKKTLLLQFASALACGDEPEQAQAQFVLAQKQGAQHLPELVVHTMQQIVDSFIRNGQFDAVPAFLRKYYADTQLSQLRDTLPEEQQASLDSFEDFLCFENAESSFEQTAAAIHTTGYYQEYARDNKSILDKKYVAVADNAMDFDFSELSNEEIAAHAAALKQRAKRVPMQKLMPEAFALCSEAGYRVLGYRHHHVQYMGAAAMADGKIAEILNGEGKTYTIVLTAFLFQLYGQRVYIVDKSTYLTQRNYNWMQGVYAMLGVDCRHISSNERLQNDPGDVFYLNLNALVFSYLWTEIRTDSTGPLITDCVIIDEADTVLVDGAQQAYEWNTPGNTPHILQQHELAFRLAQELGFDERYFRYQGYRVTLQDALYPILEQQFRLSWSDLTQLSQTRKIERMLQLAARCCCIYEQDKDYFLVNGIPMSEDGITGDFREMNDSAWFFLSKLHGLDTSIPARKLASKGQISSIICLRDFFRKFRHLCATTATAVSFQKEFKELYGLSYVAVPPHLPCRRINQHSPVYLTMRGKDQAILELVQKKHATGQPLLLVTQSTQESEKYARLLKRAGIPHQLLNARNAREASNMLAQAGTPGSILVANALAGRGADIKLGGDPELLTRRELAELGADLSLLDSFLYRLPTQEQTQLPLYKQYYSILEKYRRLTAADRQAVLDAGGLCVICTCLFQELRNEQQARGRSSRQGDVGESIVFVSMEDDTLRHFVKQSFLDWAIAQAGDGHCISADIMQKSAQNARRKLHDSLFAGIRNVNDSQHLIDLAREDFLTCRYALAAGQVTLDELLERWLTNKQVQRLWKDAKNKNTWYWLNQLYTADSRLEKARGPAADKLLVSTYKTMLSQNLLQLDYNHSKKLTGMVTAKLLELWEKYCAIVVDTTHMDNTKPTVIEQLVQEEKDLLLVGLLNWLLSLKARKPG